MKLLIEMTLQSDAVFGNGLSIPGGEDIAWKQYLEIEKGTKK